MFFFLLSRLQPENVLGFLETESFIVHLLYMQIQTALYALNNVKIIKKHNLGYRNNSHIYVMVLWRICSFKTLNCKDLILLVLPERKVGMC